MEGGRQQLVVAVVFLVLGVLLIEFWLGKHLDAVALTWVQGAWVAGILLGLWLRRRFGRPNDQSGGLRGVSGRE